MGKGILYTSNFSKLKDAKGLKVSIARYNPKWLDLNKYGVAWCKTLAPSPRLLADYKYNNLLWESYTKIYLDELCESEAQNRIHKIEDLLNSGQDVTLLCYEKSTDNCHRHILGNVFRDKGYKVKEI